MTPHYLRVAAAAAFGAWLAGCSHATEPPPSANPTAAAPSPSPSATLVPIQVHSQRVGGKYIFITQQDRNRRVYSVRADRQSGTYLGTNSATSDFVNPHVIFYGKDGKTLIADAPKAHVVEADRSVLMTGGVHAHNDEGIVLTCDELRYTENTDKVVGTGDVVVTTRDGGRYTGQRVDADLRLSQMTMSPN